MEHNFGELIVERQYKASASFWPRFFGVVSLALIAFSAYYLIVDPIVDSDTPTLGLIGLGVAALLLVLVILFTRKIKREVAIYEEGVVVIKGENTFPYHYNQIAGLNDTDIGGMVFIGGGLGIAGALVSGAVSAIASKAVDSHDRASRIRGIEIVPTPDSQLKKMGVVTTGGDILSQVYTEWIIKQNSISKENIHSQVLSFGDLELNNGEFVHEQLSGQEVRVALDDVTGMDIQDDKLRLLGQNEKGKEKSLLSISTTFHTILNWDLLSYVIHVCDLAPTEEDNA